MRFVFLGTGTSAGVPAIGCSCAVCTSDDPRDHRLRTSAAVIFTDAGGQERVVLIDAGPDLRQQALRAGLSRCDAILFTHNHVDHTFGLDEVRRFNAVMQTPIDIYAEAHTLEHLGRVYQHIFERHMNINDSFVAHLIAHRIEPGEAIDLFGVRFTPVRLLHGRLPIVGYRIEPIDPQVIALARAPDADATPDEQADRPGDAGARRKGAGDASDDDADEDRDDDPAEALPPADPSACWWPLAYCTDVSGIPPESWRALRGLRTLVLDALRHRRHPTHLTIDEAVHIARRTRAPRAWFVHMAHDLPHAQTEASLPAHLRLAYDGLVLGL